MRYSGLVLFLSAVVLSGCGGDTKKPADSTAATQTPPAAAVTAQMMPITADTVTIKMVAEGTAFKFEPADVTVKAGSGLKFMGVSGMPHNVAFIPAELTPEAKAQLNANMTGQTAELTGPNMMMPNEVYIVSLAGLKPGKYTFDCPLHKMFNMKGSVTIQ